MALKFTQNNVKGKNYVPWYHKAFYEEEMFIYHILWLLSLSWLYKMPDVSIWFQYKGDLCDQHAGNGKKEPKRKVPLDG